MTAQRALAIAALILAILSVTGAATVPLAVAVILIAIALLV